MSSEFHEPLTQEDIPLPPDRSIGILFAIVALIAAYFFRRQAIVLVALLITAAAFLAAGLLRPSILRPLNVRWMKFALLLNKIVSPIVMFALFVVTIVPAGLIMQIMRDPLRKRRAKPGESYWVSRQDAAGQSDMSNQF